MKAVSSLNKWTSMSGTYSATPCSFSRSPLTLAPLPPSAGCGIGRTLFTEAPTDAGCEETPLATPAKVTTALGLSAIVGMGNSGSFADFPYPRHAATLVMSCNWRDVVRCMSTALEPRANRLLPPRAATVVVARGKGTEFSEPACAETCAQRDSRAG